MKYTASIILDSLTPSGGSLLALIISAVLNSAICRLLTHSKHLSPPLFQPAIRPAPYSRIWRRGRRATVECPLVGEDVQDLLVLVIPDHIAQVRHAADNLRRHAARPAEQPAPAQGHKA